MEPTLRNPARERLEAGELALGAGIAPNRASKAAAQLTLNVMLGCGDGVFLA